MYRGKRIKRILITLFLFFQIIALRAQEIQGDTWKNVETNRKGRLVVYYNEQIPFIYQNSKGEIEGIEHDLMMFFAEYLKKNYQFDVQIVWQKIPDFDQFYNNVKSARNGVVGIGSVSITDERKKSIRFSPAYMPDIEVIISSEAIPNYATVDEFIEATKTLKAIALGNTTLERNLKKLQEKEIPNLKYTAVATAEEMIETITNGTDYWCYIQLPSYIQLIKEGKKVKRQKFFKVENQGLAIILPLGTDWNIPIQAFFGDSTFRGTMNKIIKKYVGDSGSDLLWGISGGVSGNSSEEVEMLTMEKQIKDLTLKQKELEINNTNLFTNLMIAAFCCLILVLLVIVFVFYYRSRVRRKINQNLSSKNKAIAQQSEELEQSYQTLNLLAEIGKSITANISFEKILETVYENVLSLMDAHEFVIGVYDPQENMIDCELYFYENTKVPGIKISLEKQNRLSVRCFEDEREIVMNDIGKEYTDYIPNLDQYKEGDLLESIICLPLISGKEVLGIISIQSKAKNAYPDYQVNILRNLAVYTTIAITNADAFRKIAQQNEEIIKQKELIERKNQHIMSSIRAALTIQQAILPFDNRMRETLKDYFTIFFPKDIVSGDFYWLNQVGNKTFMAVIDCTGHGVPGAFMSMIGYSLLNAVVNELDIIKPNQILEEFHRYLRFALRQKESNNNEGMDICFCCFEPASNGKVSVEFAGAKRPLYYFHNNELHEIKGDRSSIGGWLREDEGHRTFENHAIELDEGDIIYLTSDGFMDIPNQKRINFGRRRFVEMIRENAHLPLNSQKDNFISTLNDYQQESAQRDDITLIGIKL